LPNFYRGIATSIWFMQMIAAARIGKLRQVRRAWTSLQPQAEAPGETDDY
jgi:hypothetical protein